MRVHPPIETRLTQCQDCYKCVRHCPVKAIKIENDAASIVRELCIYCGTCVDVCPVEAKQVRDDGTRLKHLLKLKEKVIVSLAPSFVAEFRDVSTGQLIRGLKKLGFYGVSETALGAQEVSAHTAELLKQKAAPVLISSACPTVVEYIKKYRPQFTANITPLYSPLLAHCTLLKKQYGGDIAVAFIGPCISKKKESDDNPNLLHVSISFTALHRWFEEEGIRLEELVPEKDDVFIPETAAEGALYPMDGGMIAGITSSGTPNDARFMSFSGMKEVAHILDELDTFKPESPLFLELLACDGGCINGPVMKNKASTALKRYDLIQKSPYKKECVPRKPLVPIDLTIEPCPVEPPEFSEEQIKAVLAKVGKRTPKDEFNCGGCGYDNCRDFAVAVLEGKAEHNMCFNYMRKLAHKKANMLMEKMPSSVVIVDEDLRIIECNRRFASLAGPDVEMIYDSQPGLTGAMLEKVVPMEKYFKKVLDTGEDVLDKNISCRGAILHCSIFSIETNHVVGGILEDITQPSIQKEEIINKTRKVIQENLTTVQKIAYLLGENASETEMTLNSIIESFSSSPVPEDGK